MTRAKRGKDLTVNEVVLLPGDEAIVAPDWVPYKERLQPGDLSPGDLLPVEDEDARLVPTYLVGDDPIDTPLDGDARAQVRRVAEESGLKLGQVAQPLRAALTGRKTSPGIFDVLALLGREESLARIADQAGGKDAQ